MSSYSMREEPGGLVVRIEDPAQLNDFRSNAFRDGFYASILEKEPRAIALDLGTIDFLSSSGVAILVGLKRRADAVKAKLVLFNIQPVVLDLLRVIRLHQFFVIAGDEPEAMGKLSPSPAV